MPNAFPGQSSPVNEVPVIDCIYPAIPSRVHFLPVRISMQKDRSLRLSVICGFRQIILHVIHRNLRIRQIDILILLELNIFHPLT